MNERESKKYEELVKRLGRQLASRMKLENVEQSELAKRIGQSQSTISNIVNGKTDTSIKKIFLAFEALGADPLEEIRYAVIKNTTSVIDNNTVSDSVLISRPDNPAFRGQKGLFYIYFCSTDKYENEIVHGVLNIDEEGDNCTAELRIGNNIFSKSGFGAVSKDKIYKGNVSISILQKAVFINLTSEKLGERCQIICPHLSINDDKRKLKCNMGVATTISAGAHNRIPTVHRIFMTRDKLSEIGEREIHGQLLLNKDRIHISEEKFLEMCEKENPGNKFVECFEQHSLKQVYYEINEDSFKDLLVQDATGFHDLSIMRLYSDAPRNNKISSSMVGNLFHGLYGWKKSEK